MKVDGKKLTFKGNYTDYCKVEGSCFCCGCCCCANGGDSYIDSQLALDDGSTGEFRIFSANSGAPPNEEGFICFNYEYGEQFIEFGHKAAGSFVLAGNRYALENVDPDIPYGDCTGDICLKLFTCGIYEMCGTYQKSRYRYLDDHLVCKGRAQVSIAEAMV